MIDTLQAFGNANLGPFWPVVWNLIKIIVLVAPLMGAVAYLTLWERKAIGWTQIRPGPNRVGPYGLLTPIADAVKLMFKEELRPKAADTLLFYAAPVICATDCPFHKKICKSFATPCWPTPTSRRAPSPRPIRSSTAA